MRKVWAHQGSFSHTHESKVVLPREKSKSIMTKIKGKLHGENKERFSTMLCFFHLITEDEFNKMLRVISIIAYIY